MTRDIKKVAIEKGQAVEVVGGDKCIGWIGTVITEANPFVLVRFPADRDDVLVEGHKLQILSQ